MNPMTLDVSIKMFAAAVAAISAGFAVQTYARNTRTKAAEFLVSLHKAFFVDATYQAMKELLDCSGEEEKRRLATAVDEESAAFTDFLNFFELVAYLTEIGTLTMDDTNALLGYYLDKLAASPVVLRYVRRSSTGFESLRRLLADRSAGQP